VVWALKDVSFDIRAGEVVGILGGNGAGKSTLLKLLSRITDPTEGYARVEGRVGSLLEVGTGFHPELTGRDNVYLNGTILGMPRREVSGKFDDIVAFAGVDEFIDTPLKRYSSGMKVRLAFAVAAHLGTEILLLDEVLAVGDVAFQNKCLGKIGEVAKGGRTVLFVSHNMGMLTRLCSRALWLESGRVKLDGASHDVVGAYLSTGRAQGAIWTHSPAQCCDPQLPLTSARVLSADGRVANVLPFNQRFKLEVAYEVIRPISGTSILGRLTDAQGNVVWTSVDTDTNGWDGRPREAGRYLSACDIPGDLLRPGRYLLSVGSRTKMAKLISGRQFESGYVESLHENVLAFDISEVGFGLDLHRTGVITPALHWEVKRIG
jgi:lipopolysaccharide transport system ATP-binding protein